MRGDGGGIWSTGEDSELPSSVLLFPRWSRILFLPLPLSLFTTRSLLLLSCCVVMGWQISPTEEHVGLLKTIFDFEAIKALLSREDFELVYDSMHGVQGPYAKVPAMGWELACVRCSRGQKGPLQQRR